MPGGNGYYLRPAFEQYQPGHCSRACFDTTHLSIGDQVSGLFAI